MDRCEVPPSKLDLEEGWPESTRTRIHRLVYARTRRLLAGAYVIFLFVLSFVAGRQYFEQRELSLQQLNMPTDSTVSNINNLTIPRHLHYIIFDSPSSPSVSMIKRPLRPVKKLPGYCLEPHFALGYPCFHTKHATFDIVWTWVNGSDRNLQQAMAEAALVMHPEIGEKGKELVTTSLPTSKLYRDHDELRHSFRSTLQHFRPYIKQFHLVTSDFSFAVDEFTEFVSRDVDRGGDITSGGSEKHTLEAEELLTNRTLRMGQLPSWLRPEDQGHWSDGDVDINVVYQAQIFRDYAGTSFNSYSIESQFPYLPEVDQNFLYLNDDFFFTADMKPSDFFTSAYGMVLRLDPTLIVNPVPANSKVNPSGEWGPLGYSSWLLSERFGTRGRPYPVHAAKSFSMPLLDEAAQMWEHEFSVTAGHKFRGMRTGGSGDAYMSFLVTHFVVERWREALLWSWVVGRIGGEEDQWGEGEQLAAWEELGGDVEDVTRSVHVKMTERKTVEDERVSVTLRSSGEESSGRTAYTFSSADGYPYSYRTSGDKMAWPVFSGDHVGQPLCILDFEKCIGSASSASEAFKTIAFEQPMECGDCIIHALRSSSGVLGLSAFLPSRRRNFKPTESQMLYDQLLQADAGDEVTDEYEDGDMEEDTTGIPHLPLANNWAAGDFTLKGVLAGHGEVSVRAWTMRLLERYRFIIGDTSIVFLMIDGPGSAASGLKRVTPDVALLCMNDDVQSHHEMTDKIVRDWQHRRWQHPAKWER